MPSVYSESCYAIRKKIFAWYGQTHRYEIQTTGEENGENRLVQSSRETKEQ